MTITAVEQSRTTLGLVTLPYQLADTFNVGGPGPNKLLYCDTATVDYGDTNAGPPYGTVGFTTLGTSGPLSGVQAVYGAGGPASFVSMAGNTWNGHMFSVASSGAGPSFTLSYFRAPFSAGVPQAAISFINDNIGVGGFPNGILAGAPFSGFGTAADPIAVYTGVDSTTGVISALLYDGSSLTTAAQVFTVPGGGHNYNATGMKPDAGGSSNSFVCSALSGGSYYVGSADNTAGVNIFGDVLNFSASDVNTMITADNVSQGFAIVTPDAWYFYWNRHTWDTILGNSPTNGGVLVKMSNDFTKYWLYFLSWAGGDAVAQTTLNNTNNRPVVCFDGSGTIYYQDSLLYAGPILSLPSGSFTGTLSDTDATADSESGQMIAAGALADASASSDALAPMMTANRVIADVDGTSDAFAESRFVASAALSDSLVATDAFAKVGTISVSLFDVTATPDRYVGIAVASGFLDDTDIVDGFFAAVAAVFGTDDVVATSDAYSALFVSPALLADDLIIIDRYPSIMIAPGGSLHDTTGTGDAYLKPAPAFVRLRDILRSSDQYFAVLTGVAGVFCPPTRRVEFVCESRLVAAFGECIDPCCGRCGRLRCSCDRREFDLDER